MVPRADFVSPNGRPVIKEPVWTWEIPFYFYFGGLTGASTGLGYLSELRGNEELARRAWLTALAGCAISPVLLISDLGRPARFLNMLRVFKVTSPMSVGSWVLAATAPAVWISALNASVGVFPALARLAKPAAAVLGLPLATYTGALIANTAVPAWHNARFSLPAIFGAGAAASAGAAGMISTPIRHAAPARRVALVGCAAELAATHLMEHRLGELAEPYKRGLPGALSKLATVTTAAGAGLAAARGHRDRRAAIAAGALITAGAVLERWAVFRAGFRSAAKADQTVVPQRARIERGESPGASRGPTGAPAADGRT
jgi:DMSO reductase anchor subunit